MREACCWLYINQLLIMLISVFALIYLLQGARSQTVQVVSCNYSTPVCACEATYDVCEFNLNIEMLHTFTRYEVNSEYGIRSILGRPWYIDDDGVFRANTRGGKGCKHDPAIDDQSCSEPFAVDGYTFRYFIAVNGRFPGPTLIVTQYQLVKVNVANYLESDSISIHWHGLHQRGANWMDGVGKLTQCSIQPSTSFTYIFNASQYGTHWYHSHSSFQRTDGLYGALVIKQKADDVNIAKTELREQYGIMSFVDMPDKHTLLFSDWLKTSPLELFTKIRSGLHRYLNADKAPTPDTERLGFNSMPDGSGIDLVPFWSGLINGRGRHKSVNYVNTRLSVFTVSPNNIYRFRFIGAQSFYGYRVSIDEHKLTVVAMDGVWIKPTVVDYLMIFSGERYDVLIHANVTSKDDFIIRAETLEINSTTNLFRGDNFAEAILHYNRPGSSIPNSTQYSSISKNSISTRCTADSPCIALNCPFKDFASFFNITCINVHRLELLFPYMENDDELPDASDVTDDDRLIFIFHYEGALSSAAVNSRHFVSPSIPLSLLNSSQLAEVSGKEFCKKLDDPTMCDSYNPGDYGCVCTHVRNIEGGRTIQLVLASLGSINSFYESHPIHLHGHYFHVADIQYGNYSANGRRISTNTDIDCQGSPSCTSPIWRNGQDPYANMGKINQSAPLRDTIMVPSGGYVVVYFKSDNPGWWLLHCHVLDHAIEGMAVVLYEKGDSNPLPKGFQSCGNFTLSVAEYNEAITTPSSTVKTVVNFAFVLVIMVFGMVII